MQSSNLLQVPASDPPSPTPSSDGGAKSSRVCLNCRRKKKKCDKKLPTCGRCTYSLEICQHGDDPTLAKQGDAHAQAFDVCADANTQAPFPLIPFLGSQLGQTLISLENETVHGFVFRSLLQIVGDRPTVESIVENYFASINSWFTIVQKADFDECLKKMWTEPSAETGLLTLCMFLIVQTPDADAGVSMRTSLYHSVKTISSQIEAKGLSLSVPLLQSKLLISLYELCHLLPQQSYMTLGACVQMSRAFGWLNAVFWMPDQWVFRAQELKQCSILWHAIIFIDSGIQAEDLGYPFSIPNLSFSIPFPEAFDQCLQPSHDEQYGDLTRFRFADDGENNISTVVWPEAKSASYLVQAMQQRARPSRDHLSRNITDHAREILSRPWKVGHRCAALSLAYIAILKLNYPLRFSHDPEDRRSLENIVPVVASICSIAETILNGFLSPLVPPAAFAINMAAIVLISLGDAIMQDPEWPAKVRVLQRSLKVLAKRWKVAERHLHAVNVALQARMSQSVLRVEATLHYIE